MYVSLKRYCGRVYLKQYNTYKSAQVLGFHFTLGSI